MLREDAPVGATGSAICICPCFHWILEPQAPFWLALVILWMGRTVAVNGQDAIPTIPPANSIQIDCRFPGGNILVDRIEGDDIYLRQDPRDTAGFWFYWSFRVRGAEQRHLTFHFTDGKVVGVRGPAVSRDGGKTWVWLDDATVTGQSFAYRFGAEESDVHFCLAIPYQQSNLDAMLGKYAGRKDFVVENHTTSRQRRPVVRFRFGRLGDPEYRVLLTCRHHSCEMMASWVLEGLVDSVMADTERGRWFRENVEFLCVPIVDVDGVENGDQGKNRAPHDHNRDYEGDPIYPEVAALKQVVPDWSGGRLRLALDLHCPYIRGGNNQQIFLVGGPDQDMAGRLDAFSAILETVQIGTLKYDRRHNIPWGQSWNNLQEARSFARWAALLPGVDLASTLEVPYADAGKEPVTVQSALDLGADLGGAIQRWLQ